MIAFTPNDDNRWPYNNGRLDRVLGTWLDINNSQTTRNAGHFSRNCKDRESLNLSAEGSQWRLPWRGFLRLGCSRIYALPGSGMSESEAEVTSFPFMDDSQPELAPNVDALQNTIMPHGTLSS